MPHELLELVPLLCPTFPADLVLVLLTPERCLGTGALSPPPDRVLERLDEVETGTAPAALAFEFTRGDTTARATEFRSSGRDLPSPTPLSPLLTLVESIGLARPRTVLSPRVAGAARCAAVAVPDLTLPREEQDAPLTPPAVPTCCGLLLVRMVRACSKISSRDLVMREDSSEPEWSTDTTSCPCSDTVKACGVAVTPAEESWELADTAPTYDATCLVFNRPCPISL